MKQVTRRGFLRAAAAAAGVALAPGNLPADILPGERPRRDEGVTVLGPRGRVPLSFIIDDSTCLVNMGHFCMPQFAEAWPDREIYRKPWKARRAPPSSASTSRRGRLRSRRDGKEAG